MTEAVLEIARTRRPHASKAPRAREAGDDDDREPGGWAPFQPLPRAGRIPSLDPRLLPESLRAWVCDISERMDLAPEFFVIPAIVSASALIGTKVGLAPLQRSDWLEVVNLFGMIVAPPSSGKTPAETEALRPFRAVARAAGEGSASEKRPRYETTDATIESQGRIMAKGTGGRALLLYRSELDGLFQTFRKQGREADRTFYLEAWGGQGSYTVDRVKNDGSLHIEHHCLAILGGIQPGPLQGLVEATHAGGRGADGLLQRFALFAAWPALPEDVSDIDDREPDHAARDRAESAFRRLDALSAKEIGAADIGKGVPVLRFAPDAQGLFVDWRKRTMRRMRARSDLSETMRAHLGKQPALVASLSLIFHLLDHEGGPSRGVERETLERVLKLVSWLEQHARKIYAEPEDQGPRALAALVVEGVSSEVTLRQIYRKNRAGLRKVDEVRAAAQHLARLGWLRLEAPKRVGGETSERIVFRPDLLTHVEESA